MNKIALKKNLRDSFKAHQHSGRKKVYTDELKSLSCAAIRAGVSFSEASRLTGVSDGALRKWFKRQKDKKNPPSVQVLEVAKPQLFHPTPKLPGEVTKTMARSDSQAGSLIFNVNGLRVEISTDNN